jgi:hypothetical protein
MTVNIVWTTDDNRIGGASYTAKVGPWRVATVHWNAIRSGDTPYQVNCLLPGMTIKEIFSHHSNIEDAKKIGEMAVQKWFARALA